MDIKIQIIVAAGVLLGLAAIINMIRKKSLELQYALAWLFVGGGILVLDCFPPVSYTHLDVYKRQSTGCGRREVFDRGIDGLPCILPACDRHGRFFSGESWENRAWKDCESVQ